jgi:nicotinamide-nucleotide amidase
MGETSIAEKISEIESNMADGLTLAYLPDIGKVRLRISGIGEDGQLLQKKVDEVAHSIMQILGEAVYGEGDMTLSQALQELMHRKKMTLGLAESCTGGNISKHITAIPGHQDFIKVASYRMPMKSKSLCWVYVGKVSKALVRLVKLWLVRWLTVRLEYWMLISQPV